MKRQVVSLPAARAPRAWAPLTEGFPLAGSACPIASCPVPLGGGGGEEWLAPSLAGFCSLRNQGEVGGV